MSIDDHNGHFSLKKKSKKWEKKSEKKIECSWYDPASDFFGKKILKKRQRFRYILYSL